jgi:lipid-A-disaccharide synthase
MGCNTPVLVVAGEPSGDAAAAEVVRRVAAERCCCFFGLGGRALERAGVSLSADIRELSILGVRDTIAGFGRFARCWYRIRQAVDAYAPQAALLVDSPDLTLPLARILNTSGVRVVLYVGPQVWAWRPGRLRLLKDRVRTVALILPFEKPIYDDAGVPARFVGHPIMDHPLPTPEQRRVAESAVGRQPGQPLIALLPGSRPGECARHLAPMRDAAMRLARQGIRAVLAPHPNLAISEPQSGLFLSRTVAAKTLLSIADGAVVASGTATLEAARAGVPMAVVYRTDPATHFLSKNLLRLPHVALPNWIARKKVVPEILQKEVTGERLFSAANDLLTPSEWVRQRTVLAEITARLGSPGCAARVAEMVLEQLC